MTNNMDKLLATAAGLANAAAGTANAAIEKGKTEIDRAQLQKRLHRAQRQLGVLVYTLQKTGEQNDALIARYVEEIDIARSRLAALGGKAPGGATAVHTCPSCGAGVNKDATFCSCCGNKLS